jgi:uncharacterized protein YdhG (YjbR/CyaY superfamily)
MNKGNLKPRNINEYHLLFPAAIQKMLEQLRQTIKQAAPKAIETISYGMPAFQQNKVLIYYAVHKEHIGFYPTLNPIVHFEQELGNYNTSKGAIQFPINKPLPLPLIKKIMKFRVAEDNSNPKSNKNTKTKIPTINKDVLSYHSKQKSGIRLMFWSGASFDEQGLDVLGKKFKDASVFYNSVSAINSKDLKRWLKKSKEIQWDYKNIVKRKGILERLK